MTTESPSAQTLVLDFDLWHKAEQRTLKMNVSRDRLIELALLSYLDNATQNEEGDAEDARYLRAVRPKQARALARAENE